MGHEISLFFFLKHAFKWTYKVVDSVMNHWTKDLDSIS